MALLLSINFSLENISEFLKFASKRNFHFVVLFVVVHHIIENERSQCFANDELLNSFNEFT